jgi:hypothetical protein
MMKPTHCLAHTLHAKLRKTPKEALPAMPSQRKLVVLAVVGILLGPSSAAARAAKSSSTPRAVRTYATASDDGDECSGGVIEVSTFASLRNGPSTSNRELARLTNGTAILSCDSVPGWVGVLLPPKGSGSCFPVPVLAGAYRGKCTSGWVSAKYAKVTSGQSRLPRCCFVGPLYTASLHE